MLPMTKLPSTNYNEIISPGEDEKFAAYAQRLRAIQKAKSKKYGKGRLLHRKGLLALRAELIVDANLPAYAAQGIFAKPGKYDAHIRLSNGGLDVKADKMPDIRGFALKVKGIAGKSVLTGDSQSEQDFLLINHTTFGSARADEFFELLFAINDGPGTFLKHLYRMHGFFGVFGAIRRLAKIMGKPFKGFATENLSTVAPIKNGDYAVKLRIRPLTKITAVFNKADLTDDLRTHLKSAQIEYAVELQFFTDAQTTPIEDASVEWNETASPFVTVGRLVVPQQELAGAAYEKFAAETELSKFDPWNAIEAHRPLGNIMRARKHAYYVSQNERGV